MAPRCLLRGGILQTVPRHRADRYHHRRQAPPPGEEGATEIRHPRKRTGARESGHLRCRQRRCAPQPLRDSRLGFRPRAQRGPRGMECLPVENRSGNHRPLADGDLLFRALPYGHCPQPLYRHRRTLPCARPQHPDGRPRHADVYRLLPLGHVPRASSAVYHHPARPQRRLYPQPADAV